MTPSGDGVIYITDSSPEGRNAIVTVDIGAGEAWRHLDGHPSVRPSSGFVPIIWGEPVYINGSADNPITSINFGSDGITLSADGSTLYYSTTGGRELYSIPTARLRDRGPYSELLAQGSVQFLGQKGFSDGLESDSNDNIYCGSLETNSITIFSPKTGTTSTFVRDARFSWIDTMAAASDGYLYIVENQLWLRPVHWGGIDRRSKPLASLMRVKLPNEGKKIGS